ncbi:uncharacterized protein VICG_00985 [Vittaforma corneae ATCC 50505]|uniref:Uncharacterized protein n=1 Tax=Vittaforma corneae (strain ATCC 50505) TaxID=993615 RepID=L2GM50_VITCO|nr:uncharacterized protein VICG_00985 [Vittaforma corneae ATCC 50505]ELA41968.1 hypothetical protein VICG_00985 [Vittaforma corneae ATCC 50505]
MFTMTWKSRLKSKAREIVFSTRQQQLSPDVVQKYCELKLSFDQILKKLDGPLENQQSIEICKEMLNFYRCAEEVLQIFINECFKSRFMAKIQKKREIFDLADKIFKLLMLFDLIKSRSLKVFSIYSEMRVKNDEMLYSLVDDVEDDRISIFNMISLPMARLFLSMFSSQTFDLKIPFFLGKVSKIHLNSENQEKLGIFIYICEIHQWKYTFIFLIALFGRATEKGGFNINEESLKNIQGYLEMMKQQL